MTNIDTNENEVNQPPPRPTDAAGNPIYRIPECNMEGLRMRIGKMNKRAAKLKMDPLVLSEVGEEFEKRRRKQLGDDGRPVEYTIRIVLVTLVGNCPRVNGWAMAATIQHEEGGNILRTVPGFEATLPLRYRTATTMCEHCSTNRIRKDTYVLQSEVGDWKQVGRTCLADFLRTENAAGLAEWAELLASLDSEIGEFEDSEGFGGGHGFEYFSALKLLTQVACCVRADGWCSRTEAKNSFVPKCATVDSALSCWVSTIWNKLSEADRVKLTPTAEDEVKAAAAIAWAKELPVDCGSDYLWNIRVISHREQISHREAGLAGSIIAAYNRHMEREMAKKYERDHPSEWFGEKKQRLVMTLTVLSTREMDNDFGLVTLVMFRTESGSRAKWFCSGSTELEVDHTYIVKATIKDHDEYQGSKQTLLSRVMVYDAAAEAAQKIERAAIQKKVKQIKKALGDKYVCPHQDRHHMPFDIPELWEITQSGAATVMGCLDCWRAWTDQAQNSPARSANQIERDTNAMLDQAVAA